MLSAQRACDLGALNTSSSAQSDVELHNFLLKLPDVGGRMPASIINFFVAVESHECFERMMTWTWLRAPSFRAQATDGSWKFTEPSASVLIQRTTSGHFTEAQLQRVRSLTDKIASSDRVNYN